MKAHHCRAAARVLTLALLLIAREGVAGPVEDVGGPKMYALLVGTNSFLRMNLETGRYAEADVQAFGDLLTTNNYRVRTLLNAAADRRSFLLELSRLGKVLRPDDTLVVYCNLPTVRYANSTYLLGYDASLDALEVDAIRLEHLLDFVKDIPARRKLIFLDLTVLGTEILSYDSRGAPSMVVRGESPSPRPARDADTRASTAISEATPTSIRDIAIIALTSPTSTERVELQHGVFMSVLLDALNNAKADGNGDGRILLSELIAHVPRAISNLTNGALKPVTYTSSPDGFSDWIVGYGRAQPSNKVLAEAYLKRLKDWHYRDLVSLETYIRASGLIMEWGNSAPGSTASNDAMTMTLIRKYLDNRTVSDDILASDMEQLLKIAPKSR